MKVKLLFLLSLFAGQYAFSQNGKLIKGIVSSENILLQNVNVINKASKKSTVSNENGEFTIEAKVNDSIFFYAKNFQLQKLKLTLELMNQTNLQVQMFKKPEELEEVVITKTTPFKWEKDMVWEQGQIDKINVEKSVEAIKKRTVYEGTIDNGANFIAIGKMILDFFRKEKEPEKETPPKIEFAELAKRVCEEKFYVNTLKLKPEEINLFLQFCEMDPQSKKLIANYNELSMMDFLAKKNKEFQKLKAVE